MTSPHPQPGPDRTHFAFWVADGWGVSAGGRLAPAPSSGGRPALGVGDRGVVWWPGSGVSRGLTPVFRLWMTSGKKMGWLNSRILLSLLFYLIITPMGWVMALLGKRPLQLGFDSQAESYRVPKEARSADHVTKAF